MNMWSGCDFLVLAQVESHRQTYVMTFSALMQVSLSGKCTHTGSVRIDCCPFLKHPVTFFVLYKSSCFVMGVFFGCC